MKTCLNCEHKIAANNKLYCAYYPPKRVAPGESSCPIVPADWRCSFHQYAKTEAEAGPGVQVLEAPPFKVPVPGAEPVARKKEPEPDPVIPETGKKVKSFAVAKPTPEPE